MCMMGTCGLSYYHGRYNLRLNTISTEFGYAIIYSIAVNKIIYIFFNHMTYLISKVIFHSYNYKYSLILFSYVQSMCIKTSHNKKKLVFVFVFVLYLEIK